MVSAGYSSAAVEAFEAGLRGRLLRPADAGYNEARTLYNGMIDHRPALIARCEGVGYAPGRRVRRGDGFDDLGARRRPQRFGNRGLRWRPDDRSLSNEGHPRRPGRPSGACRARRPLARVGRRDAGVCPGDDRRRRFQYGNRRPDAGRRTRLAHGQLRTCVRQSRLGRCGDGGWPARDCERSGEH